MLQASNCRRYVVGRLRTRDRLHLRIDAPPDTVHATTDVENGCDGHQGNQAGKQRIFDQILAIRPSEKSDKQPSHVIVPLGGRTLRTEPTPDWMSRTAFSRDNRQAAARVHHEDDKFVGLHRGFRIDIL